MTAVYTAVFGGYDDLPPHPEMDGVDFIAFTDTPVESDAWDVRVFESDGRHPRRQAKDFRLFPSIYLPEHTETVWIDGSHEIQDPHFAARAMAAVGDSGIAVYEHPWRRCIYTEAEASIILPKYDGEPIIEQVEHYRQEGHPEDWGLYATGTIARRWTDDVGRLMEAWADEITRWSYQDQLSFPVVCRRLGMRPETFPLHQVYGNSWTLIRPHHRED